jgi:glycosyltransferase involved in cell wall biosynthesis
MKQFLERAFSSLMRRLKRPFQRFLVLEARIEQIHNWLYFNEPRLTAFISQLNLARETDAYRSTFSSAEPLVSVVLTTHTAQDSLWHVALPSILEQSYTNIEVVIVINIANQGALSIAEQRLMSIKDQRIRIVTFHGPTPKESHYVPLWQNSGTLEVNAGLRESKGKWISIFSHDDKLEKDALRSLIDYVQSGRFEFVYGDYRLCNRDGFQEVCSFPPMLGSFNFQGSLLNAELRFFDFSVTDAILQMPNDWGSLTRLRNAGVRIGHLHQITANYFPSRRGLK